MTARPQPLPAWAMRALSEERLTQWRAPLRVDALDVWPSQYGSQTRWAWLDKFDRYIEDVRLPFAPGDVRWVQEAWARVPRTAYLHSDGIEQTDDPSDADMAAIYKHGFDRCRGGFGWRSPVTMPRWASRWTLTVQSVRVGRVAEMTEADAIACGHRPFFNHANPESFMSPNGDRIPMSPHVDALQSYACEWNARHGLGAWDRNDWCAVVGWKAERGNVDG